MKEYQDKINHADEINRMLIKKHMEDCPEIVKEIVDRYDSSAEFMDVGDKVKEYLKEKQ